MTDHDAQMPAPPPPGAYPQYPPHAHPGYPVPPTAFRPLSGLAIALQILLAAQAVIDVVIVFVALRERTLLQGLLTDADSVSYAEIDSVESLDTATGVALLLLYLATGVVWMVWLYRARTNVDTWGADNQRLGRGWTIGGWFVPIANLVLPAIVTVDIAAGTDSRRDQVWQRTRQPLAVAWGIVFGLTAVLYSVVRVIEPDVPTSIDNVDGLLRDAVSYTVWVIALHVFTLVSIGLAIALVRSLTHRQTERIVLEGRAAVSPAG